MIKRLMTYCSLAFACSGFSQNSDFYSANAAYEEGNFEEAVEAYEKLISEGYQSSEVYYNLGNTYYQQGEIGKSIWSYEKALKVDPSNEDASFNLDFVKMQTIDVIDNERPGLSTWFQGVFYGPNINLWAYISIICSFLVSILLVVFFKTKTRKWKNASLLMGTISGLGLVFSLLVTHFHSSFIADHSEAIIIESEVQIKLSPLDGATNSFGLHSGTKVNVIGDNNDWVEVEVNGNSGWMRDDDLWEI